MYYWCVFQCRKQVHTTVVIVDYIVLFFIIFWTMRALLSRGGNSSKIMLPVITNALNTEDELQASFEEDVASAMPVQTECFGCVKLK